MSSPTTSLHPTPSILRITEAQFLHDRHNPDRWRCCSCSTIRVIPKPMQVRLHDPEQPLSRMRCSTCHHSCCAKCHIPTQGFRTISPSRMRYQVSFSDPERDAVGWVCFGCGKSWRCCSSQNFIPQERGPMSWLEVFKAKEKTQGHSFLRNFANEWCRACRARCTAQCKKFCILPSPSGVPLPPSPMPDLPKRGLTVRAKPSKPMLEPEDAGLVRGGSWSPTDSLNFNIWPISASSSSGNSKEKSPKLSLKRAKATIKKPRPPTRERTLEDDPYTLPNLQLSNGEDPSRFSLIAADPEGYAERVKGEVVEREKSWRGSSGFVELSKR